ncbi:MAG TPA: nickel-binding protein [Sphingomicrobium sp.]|nr:nickel-binding protein [Sphingomicrobium sp.]
MPLYMDIHNCEGAHAEDVAKAHLADMEIQDGHHVEYLKYWFNESCGKLFCLVEAPSAEAAQRVHEKAHGLVAEKLIEVDPELVDSFMGPSPVSSKGAALMPGAVAETQRDTGIRSIMFTDIVGSTELTQRLGDEGAMLFVDTHDNIVRDALAACEGREVKHTGDGIMASFISAAAAVRCACSIQSALAEHREKNPDVQLQLRIGLAAGEPVEKRNDLFGSTVQLAARLCAHAEVGQVLVSNVIAELCDGKGFSFDDKGQTQLKGFSEPVHARAALVTC